MIYDEKLLFYLISLYIVTKYNPVHLVINNIE